jgi:predicted amidohydrolase YtcJ
MALALVVSGCGPEAPAGDIADLVVTNARVVTVDEGQPEAEAVAMRGDRIIAVGSAADVESMIGDATEVIDAGGRLVIPAFIEGHGHFTGLGDSKMILDLTTARTWDDIVAQVAAAVAETPAGTLIRGRGWHQEKWETTPEPNVDGVPLHDALSAVSPDHPVYLTHASGHAAFVNGRAMEMAGIDGATPDPAGGTIVRDASGRATGLLRETAQGQVGNLRSGDATPEERAATFRRQVELAGQEALSKGVTSFHEGPWMATEKWRTPERPPFGCM